MMSALFIVSCQDEKPKEDTYSYSFSFNNDYMYAYIAINITAESEEQAHTIRDQVEDIYSMYHDLTTNYDPLEEESLYLENIYSINQKKNQKLEIDKELYDLLVYAEEIKELSNGYFDIAIGKVVDAWKDIITPEEDPIVGDIVFLLEDEVYVEVTAINPQNGRISVEGYTDTFAFYEYKQDITAEAFNLTLDRVEQIDTEDFDIILSEEDNKYYVEITGEDIKLDLGAISKGYATQKVYELFVETGIEYFSISAGSSSIIVGKHPIRENEKYWIELANPILGPNYSDAYGTFYVSDNSVTTSGNYEKYVMYDSNRYHHIVSPATKRPAQFYHTVTLIGPNAGLLDALSTALFSMPKSELEAWILAHQEELQIDVITFNQDRTVSKYLIRDIDEDF
jgi:thiamine biosynthesis lipoprotein